MTTSHRLRFLGAATCGLALLGSVAHAQLRLSGETAGYFDDLAEPNTTVVNAPDQSWATFATGIPVEGSTQSKIEFHNVSFTNVGSGDPIQVGLFTITNGMTQIGSGAPTARFNVSLRLVEPTVQTVAISTVTFHIDHTPNLPGAVPDTFSVAFDQPAPVKINNTLVRFHLNVDPADFPIDENATIHKGDITATFTPVPEPSTYALAGSLLLFGLVALRRFSRRSSAAPALVCT